MEFTYGHVRVERGGWDDYAEKNQDAYGIWRGEIGWYTDEGAVMFHAPLVEGERLVSTSRPASTERPSEDGIYAHRWFTFDEANWDEFLELSTEAWPHFEAAYGASILGLWRSVDDPGRALLITRYPSLDVWERSRPYTPGAGAEEARRRFKRRSEITKRTIVRIARLVPGKYQSRR